MKHTFQGIKTPRKPALFRFAPLLLILTAFLLSSAGEEPAQSKYRKMTAEELSKFWTEKLGQADFQPIEMPQLIRPGGKYGPRIFNFSEPAILRHEGNANDGTLTFGGEKFTYRKAVQPFSQDSSITYFAIRSPEFDEMIAAYLPGLQQRARMEEGGWNLEVIGKELAISPSMNAIYADWGNLPNFSWVMSSILVRRASMQNGDFELVLQNGSLSDVPYDAILEGSDGNNAMLAALYDPAALEKLDSAGEYPLWMLLAAFGGGLFIPLMFLIFRRPRRRKDALADDEVQILEEDPRFTSLQSDLEKAAEPHDMLKVLYAYFDESEEINSVLVQTKMTLDKAMRESKKEKIRMNLSKEKEGEEKQEESQSEAKAGEGKSEEKEQQGKKPKIKIRSEAVKSKESVEAEVPEEKQKEENKEETLRDVVEEVVRKKLVPDKQVNNEQLKSRLENQESPEERLTVAISYWDAQYDMDGEITKDLQSILRSHNTLLKVKDGFNQDNLRGALNTLALSFGGGNTGKVKALMDRSEIVDKFVKDVEADRSAPGAAPIDDRSKTSAHIAEVIRALETMGKFARVDLEGGPQADYNKAIEGILAGFLLDGTARDIAAGRPFDELKVRMDARLELFRSDVRFAGHSISSETVDRLNKMVHAFAGQVDQNSNAYYQAYFERYGDLFDKLASYDDPPSLDELREWWSQAFEMVIHSYDYFRFTLMGQENSRAKLNIMMVVDGLKLHELPDGDVRPFTENVTEVPRAVRNAREMARSIGIERLDNVLIDGYYIHPKALEPVE